MKEIIMATRLAAETPVRKMERVNPFEYEDYRDWKNEQDEIAYDDWLAEQSTTLGGGIWR